MKKTAVILLAASLALTGCTSSRDLAKTLRYADDRAIEVAHFPFAELQTLRKGEACTVNFLNWFPLFGDGSLITAIERGQVNRVRYVGETGYWYFPFATNCTVVFGDDQAPPAEEVAARAAPEAATRAALAKPEAARPGPAPAAPAAPSRGFWQ